MSTPSVKPKPNSATSTAGTHTRNRFPHLTSHIPQTYSVFLSKDSTKTSTTLSSPGQKQKHKAKSKLDTHTHTTSLSILMDLVSLFSISLSSSSHQIKALSFPTSSFQLPIFHTQYNLVCRINQWKHVTDSHLLYACAFPDMKSNEMIMTTYMSFFPCFLPCTKS